MWLITVVSHYAVVGACWIPVVAIQFRIRNLIAAGQGRENYEKLMRNWVALGVPAFAIVMVIFLLMVSKIGAYG